MRLPGSASWLESTDGVTFFFDGLLAVATLVLGTSVVVLAAQPIYANDTWIHLALGRAFAEQGPWLSADPYLFAAPGPPSPSSWLGSLVIYGAQSGFGFLGLRLAGALWVAGILALAWWLGRRATGSTRLASVVLALFVVLSTYRLVQLRPELFSIAATLAIYPLLIAPRQGPRWTAIGVAAVATGIWANLHAAFLLGPILVLGVGGCLFGWSLLDAPAECQAHRRRAARLLTAGGLMLAASLANPQGWDAHLAYFASGQSTLALGAVVDEWARTDLFALPSGRLPPTWAAWLACWLALASLVAGCIALALEVRGGSGSRRLTVDPGLVALAAGGLIGTLLASRFLWLAIFALMLGGSLLCSRGAGAAGERRRSISAACAFAVLLTTGAHFATGDWPLVSRSIRAVNADYRDPYYASKFNGQAMWFLADSGVEGRIFNPYPLGGFMSFWLAPALQMSSSGTMNVDRAVMIDNLAIAARQVAEPGEDFASLLDRLGLDLFLGVGLPIETIPGKRGPSSVRYLELEADWIPIYRSLRSAVYLRRNARNQPNLERVSAYYEREGVPFDPVRGLDLERVLVHATSWAIDQGLVPRDFEALTAHARASLARGRIDASAHRLARLYAVLGLYRRSVELDRRILDIDPTDARAARRMLWCLLRERRFGEALEWVGRQRTAGAGSGGAGRLLETIERIQRAEPDERARLLEGIPLFSSSAAGEVQWDFVSPSARAVSGG